MIVIGAGLSGLNAALLLEEIGARVMLLEGQDRVGGKMLTFSKVEGLPEAGGQSIGPGYGRLIDAAQRSGVVLEDTLPRLQKHPQVTLVLDGTPIPPAAWKDSARNPFPEPLRAAMPWTYAAAVLSKANPLVALEEWFAAKNARHDISSTSS